MLRLLVSIGFQVLFHSPPGVLFTFPSRYYTLSVTKSYLAFEMVLTCSHWISRVLWYSGYPPSEIDFAYKAITLFRPVFQRCSAIDSLNYAGPKPHRNKFLRFGLFRFRSPLLTKSLFYFLFLRVLRCFSSPGSLHPHYVFMR